MSKGLKIWLSLSLVCLQLVSASCGAGARRCLSFEALDIRPSFEPEISRNLDNQIHVVAGWESLPDILQPPYYPGDVDPLDADERAELNEVDFTSRFLVFVVATFHTIAVPEFTVTKKWQEENTLYVQADFEPAPSGAGNSPGANVSFMALSVQRDGLPAYGDLAVVLLDQGGAGVATNTAVIPKEKPAVVLPVAFFPVQMAETGAEPYPQEQAGGKLILEDGYLRLSLRSNLASQLLVWPGVTRKDEHGPGGSGVRVRGITIVPATPWN
jgi:hypothetical protein